MSDRLDAEALHAARGRDPDRPWYDYAAALIPRDPGRWADLGCGRGELLDRDDVPPGGLGLDRDRAALAEIEPARSAVHRFVVSDLGRPLPFATGSLDGASLVEVIEHLPEAERLVAELARVLRPGAWLVLTTPNVAHVTYRIRALTGHPPKQEGYHFRFFTRRTLAAMLEAGGFRIEASASYGKQALLTKIARLTRPEADRRRKVFYRVPTAGEALLARHFVWRVRRVADA